eukprot:gene10099-22304_t
MRWWLIASDTGVTFNTSVVVSLDTLVQVTELKGESVYNSWVGAQFAAPLGNAVGESCADPGSTMPVSAPAASVANPPPVVWFLSRKELNRRMHALNGNTPSPASISGKEARNAICTKLVRAGIDLSDAQSCYDR